MESTESPCVPENPVPESEIKESESLFLVNCIQLVYFLLKKKKILPQTQNLKGQGFITTQPS